MNDFHDQFARSMEHMYTDIALIQPHFIGAKIEKSPDELDKKGADYTVIYPNGKTYYVDVKRRLGTACKRYARYGELELALEIKSFTSANGRTERPGWTIDTNKITDYVLYAFDKRVDTKGYMFPFMQLRNAFIDNFKAWKKKGYDVRTEESKDGHKSEAMFVPISAVVKAVSEEISGRNEECIHRVETVQSA